MPEEIRVDEVVDDNPEQAEDSMDDRLERIEALLGRMVEALERKPAPKPGREPAEPKRTLNNIID